MDYADYARNLLWPKNIDETSRNLKFISLYDMTPAGERMLPNTVQACTICKIHQTT